MDRCMSMNSGWLMLTYIFPATFGHAHPLIFVTAIYHPASANRETILSIGTPLLMASNLGAMQLIG